MSSFGLQCEFQCRDECSSGLLTSSSATSCSVPLVFTPSSLLAKDPKTGAHVPWDGPSPSLSPQRWIDGSVDNDLPMTRLAEMFNVNHFIVSQVNPHVVPFLRSEEGAGAEALTVNGGNNSLAKSWLNTAAVLAKGELLHRMHVLSDMHIFPTTLTKARSILSQRYSGDITILPEIPYSQFPLVLQNPTPDFMMSAMRAGERATWPKLSRIRNALSIEMALDDAVGRARGRVVFSASQVDLRLGSFSKMDKASGPRGRGKGRMKNETWRHSSAARLDSSAEATNTIRKIKPTSKSRSRKSPGRLEMPKIRVAADGMVSSSSATMDDDDGTESDVKKGRGFFALSSSPLSSPASSSTEVESPFDRDGDIDLGGIRTSLPELWPSTRQLFPSRSQPATPYANRSSSNSFTSISPMLTMTAAPENKIVPKQAPTTRQQIESPTPLSQRTTSSSKQSEPERRYKRLFHRPPTPGATTPVVGGLSPLNTAVSDLSLTTAITPKSASPSTAKSGQNNGTQRRKSIPGNGQPLPIDISGTRGMMLRKKSQKLHRRSLSTGLRGLAPPEAQ